MPDLYSHIYLGIPAGLALLVVPSVLIESQWRLRAKRREEARVAKAERERAAEKQAA